MISRTLLLHHGKRGLCYRRGPVALVNTGMPRSLGIPFSISGMLKTGYFFGFVFQCFLEA